MGRAPTRLKPTTTTEVRRSMTDAFRPRHPGDARQVAISTAVVLAMVAAAGFAYLLLDIILLFFVGIVVATALRPLHDKLCRYGVPRGLAVLLLYLALLVVIGLLGLLIGPVLIEQSGTFATAAPATYENVRTWLRTSRMEILGQRLPPFAILTQSIADAAPQWFEGAVGITSTLVTLPTYFVSVLAIAFYWTLEVPRLERLLLSLIPVERRPRALNIWHEIETRLGGFMRGQGLAMLAIGTASAVGYWLIGLPNVIALAVLAGLLEAVPMIGPILGTIPATLVALSMGPQAVLLVMAFATFLQVVENNILIPRIMDETVGVSALVGLFAVLAFGTLYGLVGVLIAIPIAAVIQVLIDTLVVNVEPVPTTAGGANGPDLLGRLDSLRQQARRRMRARTSRLGIDPGTADHLVDAVDQQIEGAAGRVEHLLAMVASSTVPSDADALLAIMDRLQEATAHIQRSVERVDAVTNGEDIPPRLANNDEPSGSSNPPPQGGTSLIATTDAEQGPPESSAQQGGVDDVEQASLRFQEELLRIDEMIVAATQDSAKGAEPIAQTSPSRPESTSTRKEGT